MSSPCKWNVAVSYTIVITVIVSTQMFRMFVLTAAILLKFNWLGSAAFTAQSAQLEDCLSAVWEALSSNSSQTTNQGL